MAAKEAVSFDEIIKADRQRRKNEALANEIFGKGRRASAPGSGIRNRKAPSGPSLASRIGIAKRSTSTASKSTAKVNGVWGHDLHHINNPQASRVSQLPRNNSAARITRDNRLYAALQTDSSSNGTNNHMTVRGAGNGISIRGLAGPYVVVGSNFAPGTTAADIESAMTPIGGEIISCKVITSSPTVIAEMVFTDKGGAENVIATFNNEKADGRVLHIYMKQGPSTSSPTPVHTTPTGPKPPRPDLFVTKPSYDGQRELSDRNRRRAEPELQDGSYGFNSNHDRMDLEMDDRVDGRRDDRRNSQRGRDYERSRDDRGLYSDDIVPRPRGRGFR
ncbi:MAG: hypothetical protein M1830_001421 [Pleopsidium flavum]|nr:MAG: hypothetical protein M1830_001421 [Pleopsidium flavum]